VEGLTHHIQALLEEMQTNLFNTALKFREDHITEVDDFDAFKSVLSERGGFISAHWDGTPETEEAIKKQTKATIRCIPLTETPTEGKCVYSEKPSSQRVLFAKAY
jgi:prolyl-tRNA synthetase